MITLAPTIIANTKEFQFQWKSNVLLCVKIVQVVGFYILLLWNVTWREARKWERGKKTMRVDFKHYLNLRSNVKFLMIFDFHRICMMMGFQTTMQCVTNFYHLIGSWTCVLKGSWLISENFMKNSQLFHKFITHSTHQKIRSDFIDFLHQKKARFSLLRVASAYDVIRMMMMMMIRENTLFLFTFPGWYKWIIVKVWRFSCIFSLFMNFFSSL